MPGKLTDETAAIIIEAITDGAHPDVAAQKAHINRRTYSSWLNKGRAERERRATRKANPNNDMYVEFLDAIEQAAAAAEASMVGHITRQAKHDGKLALAYLERRHPKRWSRKINVTLADEYEKMLHKLEANLPADIFENVLEILATPEELLDDSPDDMPIDGQDTATEPDSGSLECVMGDDGPHMFTATDKAPGRCVTCGFDYSLPEDS